ncbi:hypothetical protein EB796_007848 [Bugula neritina]|uniref:Uncharacterized protein n=1 Tax=Bugula neritina TaxID=10212 RepID=A0A7J7K7C0_BUGNE|nr:hypothetical protein EB796_007848 [Bugula neritina]
MQDPKPKERVQQKARELAIQEKLEVYEALKSMKARADIVSDLCQTDIKYQTDSGICWGSSRSRTLLSTKDKSLMYTPIPKCGWTTWMVVFFDHYKVYHDGNTGYVWVNFHV